MYLFLLPALASSLSAFIEWVARAISRIIKPRSGPNGGHYGYIEQSRGVGVGAGAVAAAVVGTVILGTSLRCGAALLAFFFASSKLTQYAEDRKDNDEEFKKGGQRDWRQV